MSDQKDGGFTILEVLIALMIISISLAVVSQAIALSVRNIAQAAERERVLMVVDQVRMQKLLQYSSSSVLRGSSSGLDWTVETIDPLHPGFFTIMVTTEKPAVHSYRFLITNTQTESKVASE